VDEAAEVLLPFILFSFLIAKKSSCRLSDTYSTT
jgi:hypothetical protein